MDTAGFGTVTIAYTTTGSSASVAVTVSDASGSGFAADASNVIDPMTGGAPTITGLASGVTGAISYVGPKRYIKAVGTNANVIIVLGEPRKGWADPSA